MNSRALLRLLLSSLLVATVSCNQLHAADPAPVTPPLGEKLVKDLTYLASDELEGRGIGTRGLDLAADYIAARFAALELRPLPGQNDYFQPFTVNGAVSVNPASSLNCGSTSFEQSRQYIPQGFSSEGEFSGPIVFAGYSISSSEYQYDDFAGMDVKGKIVLALRYEPHKEDGTSRFAQADWSGEAALNAKAEAAARAGAIALLLVNPPRFHGSDQLIPVNRGGAKSAIPFIHIKQEVANDLLRRGGSEKNLSQLQGDIDTSGKPESFALKNVLVSGKVVLNRNKVPAKNVMAYLRGGELPDEYIVIGAHYDHLGRGGPGSLAPNSAEIHNGADDNASGTCAVLNLAERLVYAGRRQRSVLFVLFSGEEEGLLGSQYFVEHPPVPLEKIVAMLNLDMVGRVRNDTLFTGGSGTAEPFDAILNAADQASPLQLKSIGKGGRGPSDHQSFAMKHIPVIFFFSGMHPDYHRPTDDADRINYAGIVETVKLSMRVVDSLAKMPRQQYVAKFDSQPLSLNSGSGSRGIRVTLGVVPDYGTDESTIGVRITGTSPGSPAELAGLLEGDIIVQLGEKKIENLYDLTDFLSRGKVGDKVPIIIMRNNQRVELSATLVERPG